MGVISVCGSTKGCVAMTYTSFHLVVPTYNEAETVVPTLRELDRVLRSMPDLEYRIIVADNGSTDGTAEVVRRHALPNVEVLVVPGRGKGRAIVYAAQHSRADIFGFCDVDLSADPSIIPSMLFEIERGAHFVIGSRLIDQTKVSRGFLRTWSSRFFNVVRRLVLGIKVVDSQCGLKVVDGSCLHIVQDAQETGWFLDLELLAQAERHGLAIVEVPVQWTEFRYPARKSKLRVLRDGLEGIRAMVRIRRRLQKVA